MAGDFAGLPVVFLQNALNYRFRAENEQLLHDTGLCMLSICRPGHGDTDPPAEGADALKTAADDIAAMLDQLGYNKAVLMTSTNTAPFMYALAPMLEHRLYGLVPCTALLPPAYLDETESMSAWVKALSRALKKHPSLARYFVKVGVPAWAKMGAKVFFSAQFQGDKEKLAQFTRPDFLAEAQHALETSAKQGTAGMAFDISQSFTDFSADIDASNLPILLIHGAKDEVFPISGVRRFAQDYSARARLVELPDAGNLILDLHVGEVCEAVKTLFPEPSVRASHADRS